MLQHYGRASHQNPTSHLRHQEGTNTASWCSELQLQAGTGMLSSSWALVFASSNWMMPAGPNTPHPRSLITAPWGCDLRTVPGVLRMTGVRRHRGRFFDMVCRPEGCAHLRRPRLPHQQPPPAGETRPGVPPRRGANLRQLRAHGHALCCKQVPAAAWRASTGCPRPQQPRWVRQQAAVAYALPSLRAPGPRPVCCQLAADAWPAASG